MRWSFAVANFSGTVVRIHGTFVIFLAWIVFAAYAAGGLSAALSSGLFFVLLFGSVLLHEFGHILTARRFGVRTPDVTLLPIGGVAQMERIPEKPQQELLIALAGPAVNLLIGVVLVLALGGLPKHPDMNITNLGRHLWTHLAFTNLALAGFNLIPAFPMDGGRALRALLATRLGYARATSAAALIGQGLAILFGILGLASGNLMLALIAVFIYFSAGAEASTARVRSATLGATVADLMVTRFETLPADIPIDVAAQSLIHTPQREFIVTDSAGRVHGLVTRDLISDALRRGRADARLADIMTADLPVVSPRHLAEHAIGLLQSGSAAVAVLDDGGNLVGMLTLENLLQSALLQDHRPRPRIAASNVTVPQTRPVATGATVA